MAQRAEQSSSGAGEPQLTQTEVRDVVQVLDKVPPSP